MATVLCPSCSRERWEHAEFCRGSDGSLAPACPSCGTDLDTDASFCHRCGTSLAQATPPPSAPTDRPSLALITSPSAFLVLLALGALLLAAACGPGYDAQSVELSETEPRDEESPTAVAPRAPVLRLAVAPVISPRETFVSHYGDLLEYVGDTLEMPVELIQGKTYAEINDQMRSGDATFAFVCTNPYLQGQEDFGMELLVAPEVQGQSAVLAEVR